MKKRRIKKAKVIHENSMKVVTKKGSSFRNLMFINKASLLKSNFDDKWLEVQ